MILDPERYHYHVAGPTLTGTREVIMTYRFLRRGSRVDTTLLERVNADDRPIYITHPYGFILERRKSGHTWEVAGYNYFVKNAIETESGIGSSFIAVG